MNGIKSVHFKADYNYGPQEQTIKKQHPITAFFNAVVILPLKSFIYPGASFLKAKFIDEERVEKARQALVGVGGQPVTLQTPDGDKIDGMHLKAKDFKAALEKYCDYREVDNGDGTVKQLLTIKPEYCTLVEQQGVNKQSFTYMKPSEEALKFIQNSIKSLGISNTPFALLSKENNIRGYQIELGNAPKDLKKMEQEVSNFSHPTALLSP